MHIHQLEQHQLALAQGTGRVDLYGSIHKGFRMMMCDTLVAVGRLDVDDEFALVQCSHRVFELLELCQAHLRHENAFIHAAMQARAPGSSEAIGREHDAHEQHIVQISRMTGALVKSPAAQRQALADALYRALSLFIADNFQHMADEENGHNPILWSHYGDDELQALHAALVASIAPPEMLATMRWLVPACNPGQRAHILGDMQSHAPAAAVQAVLDTIRPHLDDREWAKLSTVLQRAPQHGRVGAVG